MKIIGDVSTMTTYTTTNHLTGETRTRKELDRRISVEDGPIVRASPFSHAYTHFKVEGMQLQWDRWEAFGRALKKDGSVGSRETDRRYWASDADADEFAAALQPILDATALGGTL